MNDVMNDCGCRVCTVGKYVKDKYGLVVWEAWYNDCLILEGIMYDSTPENNKYNVKMYNDHYDYANIESKYNPSK